MSTSSEEHHLLQRGVPQNPRAGDRRAVERTECSNGCLTFVSYRTELADHLAHQHQRSLPNALARVNRFVG
jgi:hypothetical protein